MNNVSRLLCAALLALVLGFSAAAPAAAQRLSVTRTTLRNGLQVVVVRDPLAPVVTSEITYRAGSNEEQYAGQAHALEHMMFRGTSDVSSGQLFEIGQLLGGDYDADTQTTATHYFFTAPAQYLDVALRLEADRAQHLLLNQKDWEAERGAIEQEVTADDSDPFEHLAIRTVLPAIFAGTPYANDTLGTLQTFNQKINANVLRHFYSRWYHPNNAVLVIAGDVQPSNALAQVRKYFGGIPAGKLPAKPAVHLRSLKARTYKVTTDYPVTLVAYALQSPGWSDKDYAAMQVLESVLNNQRSDLFQLVASGKAFGTQAVDIEANPHASASIIYGAIPASSDPQTFLTQLRGVITNYQKWGVPADLVAVAKQRALASKEFDNNSIEGVADAWSQALGNMNQTSPDEQVAAIQRVQLADVNRVLRKYVDFNHMITIVATPSNSGKVRTGGAQTKEQNSLPPSKAQPLPAWAQAAFAGVHVPNQTIAPVSMTLSNGMRLIVQPEHVSHTVVVQGRIATNQAIEAPAGKQGVEDILNALFPFGTTQYDRLALREQLDRIAADVQAGTSFSLTSLTSHFERGVQLLADEELHPALPAAAFQIEKQQTVAGLAGEIKSPQYLSDVALAKALYPASDPENIHATPETASSVTLDDVKAYYEKAFRPDMTTVVVIGDVQPAQVKAVFEKYFGSWKATGVRPKVDLPAVPRNTATNVQVPDPSRVQSSVTLAQVTDLRRSDPQWADARLGDSIYGDGPFGTMLMDDLRTRTGLVYGAYSQLRSHRNRSTFTISLGCDPDKVLRAEQLALSDLARMESGSIDAGRLQRSKTMLMSDVPLREQSFDGVANQLLSLAELGLPLDQDVIDARRELSASASQVQAALKHWIDPSRFVRVILGPGPK